MEQRPRIMIGQETREIHKKGRSATTFVNFGPPVDSPITEEAETIYRLIREVSQNRDTVFSIEEILDEIFD